MTATSEAQTAGDYSSMNLEAALALLGEKDAQIARLLHQLELLKRMHFGPRSKRSSDVKLEELLPFPGLQRLLQDVAERAAAREKERTAEPPKPKPTPKPRRSLDELPSNLPRLRHARALTEAERACGCGGKLHEIRQETTRRLEKLSVVYVDEHVTTHYGCRACGSLVSAAPDKEIVIEGGNLGPHGLAETIVDRFANHVPYNRLEQTYAQLGVPIGRSVLCSSVLRCGELLDPVYEAMKAEVLGDILVQLDDTPVIVRNGNRAGRKTGRIWVYRNQQGDVVFDFRLDRCRDGPATMLESFRGFVQGDAYSGHDCLFLPGSGRREVGCWAHVVRKFDDASSTDKRLAAEFDVLQKLLFRVESEARGMSPAARQAHRDAHARPVLDEIKSWLDARSLTVLPKSPMGQAISYARNQWGALVRYLEDGRIEDITNNGAERALRRVAIGRKNWMFIGIEEAGRPAVVLMSFIQTCRERGINVLDYLRDVLVQISAPGSSADIAKLTPRGWMNDPAARDRVQARRARIQSAVQQLSYR